MSFSRASLRRLRVHHLLMMWLVICAPQLAFSQPEGSADVEQQGADQEESIADQLGISLNNTELEPPGPELEEEEGDCAPFPLPEDCLPNCGTAEHHRIGTCDGTDPCTGLGNGGTCPTGDADNRSAELSTFDDLEQEQLTNAALCDDDCNSAAERITAIEYALGREFVGQVYRRIVPVTEGHPYVFESRLRNPQIVGDQGLEDDLAALEEDIASLVSCPLTPDALIKAKDLLKSAKAAREVADHPDDGEIVLLVQDKDQIMSRCESRKGDLAGSYGEDPRGSYAALKSLLLAEATKFNDVRKSGTGRSHQIGPERVARQHFEKVLNNYLDRRRLKDANGTYGWLREELGRAGGETGFAKLLKGQSLINHRLKDHRNAFLQFLNDEPGVKSALFNTKNFPMEDLVAYASFIRWAQDKRGSLDCEQYYADYVASRGKNHAELINYGGGEGNRVDLTYLLADAIKARSNLNKGIPLTEQGDELTRGILKELDFIAGDLLYRNTTLARRFPDYGDGNNSSRDSWQPMLLKNALHRALMQAAEYIRSEEQLGSIQMKAYLGPDGTTQVHLLTPKRGLINSGLPKEIVRDWRLPFGHSPAGGPAIVFPGSPASFYGKQLPTGDTPGFFMLARDPGVVHVGVNQSRVDEYSHNATFYSPTQSIDPKGNPIGIFNRDYVEPYLSKPLEYVIHPLSKAAQSARLGFTSSAQADAGYLAFVKRKGEYVVQGADGQHRLEVDEEVSDEYYEYAAFSFATSVASWAEAMAITCPHGLEEGTEKSDRALAKAIEPGIEDYMNLNKGKVNSQQVRKAVKDLYYESRWLDQMDLNCQGAGMDEAKNFQRCLSNEKALVAAERKRDEEEGDMTAMTKKMVTHFATRLRPERFYDLVSLAAPDEATRRTFRHASLWFNVSSKSADAAALMAGFGAAHQIAKIPGLPKSLVNTINLAMAGAGGMMTVDLGAHIAENGWDASTALAKGDMRSFNKLLPQIIIDGVFVGHMVKKAFVRKSKCRPELKEETGVTPELVQDPRPQNLNDITSKPMGENVDARVIHDDKTGITYVQPKSLAPLHIETAINAAPPGEVVVLAPKDAPTNAKTVMGDVLTHLGEGPGGEPLAAYRPVNRPQPQKPFDFNSLRPENQANGPHDPHAPMTKGMPCLRMMFERDGDIINSGAFRSSESSRGSGPTAENGNGRKPSESGGRDKQGTERDKEREEERDLSEEEIASILGKKTRDDINRDLNAREADFADRTFSEALDGFGATAGGKAVFRDGMRSIEARRELDFGILKERFEKKLLQFQTELNQAAKNKHVAEREHQIASIASKMQWEMRKLVDKVSELGAQEHIVKEGWLRNMGRVVERAQVAFLEDADLTTREKYSKVANDVYFCLLDAGDIIWESQESFGKTHHKSVVGEIIATVDLEKPKYNGNYESPGLTANVRLKSKRSYKDPVTGAQRYQALPPHVVIQLRRKQGKNTVPNKLKLQDGSDFMPRFEANFGESSEAWVASFRNGFLKYLDHFFPRKISVNDQVIFVTPEHAAKIKAELGSVEGISGKEVAGEVPYSEVPIGEYTVPVWPNAEHTKPSGGDVGRELSGFKAQGDGVINKARYKLDANSAKQIHVGESPVKHFEVDASGCEQDPGRIFMEKQVNTIKQLAHEGQPLRARALAESTIASLTEVPEGANLPPMARYFSRIIQLSPTQVLVTSKFGGRSWTINSGAEASTLATANSQYLVSLTPGEATTVAIRLRTDAVLFPHGHRITVETDNVPRSGHMILTLNKYGRNFTIERPRKGELDIVINRKGGYESETTDIKVSVLPTVKKVVFCETRDAKLIEQEIQREAAIRKQRLEALRKEAEARENETETNRNGDAETNGDSRAETNGGRAEANGNDRAETNGRSETNGNGRDPINNAEPPKASNRPLVDNRSVEEKITATERAIAWARYYLQEAKTPAEKERHGAELKRLEKKLKQLQDAKSENEHLRRRDPFSGIDMARNIIAPGAEGASNNGRTLHDGHENGRSGGRTSDRTQSRNADRNQGGKQSVIAGGLSSSYTSNLKVYPVPTSHQLSIEGIIDVSAPIEVYNMVGEEVQVAVQWQVNDRTLDVSGLSPGVYFLRVVSATRHPQSAQFIVR